MCKNRKSVCLIFYVVSELLVFFQQLPAQHRLHCSYVSAPYLKLLLFRICNISDSIHSLQLRIIQLFKLVLVRNLFEKSKCFSFVRVNVRISEREDKVAKSVHITYSVCSQLLVIRDKV